MEAYREALRIEPSSAAAFHHVGIALALRAGGESHRVLPACAGHRAKCGHAELSHPDTPLSPALHRRGDRRGMPGLERNLCAPADQADPAAAECARAGAAPAHRLRLDRLLRSRLRALSAAAAGRARSRAGRRFLLCRSGAAGCHHRAFSRLRQGLARRGGSDRRPARHADPRRPDRPPRRSQGPHQRQPPAHLRPPARARAAQLARLPRCHRPGDHEYRLTDPHLEAEQPGVVALPETFWCYEPRGDEPAVNELPWPEGP